MQVSVETTSHLGRKLIITIPAEKIEEEQDSRLRKLAKTVKMDGFRPGKVPFKVVKEKYTPSIRSEVIGELISKSLYEALGEKSLIPAGTPVIENVTAHEGQGLEFQATFEVYPPIELTDFSKISIDKTVAAITDSDLDKTLENIQKQHADWKDVERPAKEGDQVYIDFEGFVDDKPLEHGSGKDTALILGSNTFIPGFEAGLEGAKKGDEREIKVTFPEDYQAKEIAGKLALFKVKINRVTEPQLPELNDKFAEKLGVAEGEGIKGLREQMRKHMTRELNQVMQRDTKAKVFEKLIELHTVEVPKALIDREVQQLHQQMHANEKGHKHDNHSVHDHPELPEMAKKRVVLGLIVGEIIKKFDVKPEPDRVRQAIENIAEAYQHPQDVVKWYYGNKEQLSGIENAVLEDQIVDLILEKAQVNEKNSDFTSIMQG